MKALTRFALVALVIATFACKKEEPAAPEPAPAEPAPDPAAEAAAAKAAAEAEAKQQEAERVAKSLAEAEANAAKERERWTDAVEKKAAALRDRKFKNTKQALSAIVASEHRVPGNAERDVHRHPVETLTFFGLQPSMTVIEVGSGSGWYTELLAPVVARDGKLIAVSYDPEGPADSMRTVYGKRLQMFLDKSPALYGDVQMVAVNPPDDVDLGIEGQADLAVAIREMHNWHRRGYMDAYLRQIHAALEEGGTFGVVQHRAAEGANPDESAEKGYLPEAWVIEQVEAAGFELVDKSEVNANPKDTKDHPEGVWTLPPGFALEDTDREKYAAIGESDRMTLKFKKVAQPAAAEGAQ